MKPMSQQDMEKVMEGLWVLVKWLTGEEKTPTKKDPQEGPWVCVPEVMDVRELAEVMNISRWSAYELCRRPDFPAVRIGRRVLIRKDQLITWMDKQTGI